MKHLISYLLIIVAVNTAGQKNVEKISFIKPIIKKAKKHYWSIDTLKKEYVYADTHSLHSIVVNVNAFYDSISNKVFFIDNNLDTTYLEMHTKQTFQEYNMVKYQNDLSAKFSMICAEMGGSILSNYEKTLNDACIISLSIDNRQRVETIRRWKFSKPWMLEFYDLNSYQMLFTGKQFTSAKLKSYTNFKYGFYKRTRKKLKRMVGLCATWNAMQNPAEILMQQGMMEPEKILGFAHNGNPSLFQNRDLNIKMLNCKVKRVVTSDRLFKVK